MNVLAGDQTPAVRAALRRALLSYGDGLYSDARKVMGKGVATGMARMQACCSFLRCLEEGESGSLLERMSWIYRFVHPEKTNALEQIMDIVNPVLSDAENDINGKRTLLENVELLNCNIFSRVGLRSCKALAEMFELRELKYAQMLLSVLVGSLCENRLVLVNFPTRENEWSIGAIDVKGGRNPKMVFFYDAVSNGEFYAADGKDLYEKECVKHDEFCFRLMNQMMLGTKNKEHASLLKRTLYDLGYSD